MQLCFFFFICVFNKTVFKLDLFFLKPFLTLFDIYFLYQSYPIYNVFSRFLALRNMHVHRGRNKVRNVVFSTLKKGYIPETCVFFFSKPFLTLFDIYFLYQSYRIYDLFSRFLALRNMYRGRYWVRNALGMMDRHNAIVTLQYGTDIKPIYRFLALRNACAGHDGQYWYNNCIRKRLLSRRNHDFQIIILFLKLRFSSH